MRRRSNMIGSGFTRVAPPVALVVESLYPSAADMGITEEGIITTVHSRLRGARIYKADAVPYLYVNVVALKRALSYELELKKCVTDLETGINSMATTWSNGGAGTHGQDPGHLQSISQLMDRFIDEYVAVNGSVCE